MNVSRRPVNPVQFSSVDLVYLYSAINSGYYQGSASGKYIKSSYFKLQMNAYFYISRTSRSGETTAKKKPLTGRTEGTLRGTSLITDPVLTWVTLDIGILH